MAHPDVGMGNMQGCRLCISVHSVAFSAHTWNQNNLLTVTMAVFVRKLHDVSKTVDAGSVIFDGKILRFLQT